MIVVIHCCRILQVYPYTTWNAKTIPIMQEGQQFDPIEIKMTEHETSPPELLKMEDLLKLMQRHEIGTDATMGQHIETIMKRNFAAQDQAARLTPTTLGIALVNGYVDDIPCDPCRISSRAHVHPLTHKPHHACTLGSVRWLLLGTTQCPLILPCPSRTSAGRWKPTSS